MPVKPVAIAALFVTALSLGLGWSHVLQIHGKAGWDAAFWRAAMETLYRDYATWGAAGELGAIALAALLALALRRRPGFGLAAAGAALLAIAFFGLWIGFIMPTNAVFATWTPQTVPADWTLYRDRWETWHAMIAAVKALAFLCLAAGALSGVENKRAA